MIKYVLTITLILVLVMHCLTPSWMLTDFHQWGDWGIVFFLTANCVALLGDVDGLNKRLLVICIISSIVFVSTGVTRGEEVLSTSIRLFEIINVDLSPSSAIASTIEFINLISILLFLITEMVLSVKTIKSFVRKWT